MTLVRAVADGPEHYGQERVAVGRGEELEGSGLRTLRKQIEARGNATTATLRISRDVQSRRHPGGTMLHTSAPSLSMRMTSWNEKAKRGLEARKSTWVWAFLGSVQ